MNRAIYILFLLTFFMHVSAQQARDKYINQQKKIKREIEVANELLEDTRKKKNVSLRELSIVEQKIESRQRLINSLQLEINEIEKKTTENDNKLKSLKVELAKAKERYSNAVYQSYLNYNESQALMFLLASNSLNQLYTRYQYIQQYRENRKKYILIMNAVTAEIEKKQIELLALKKEKVDRLNDILSEKHSLNKERNKRSDLIVRLKNDEQQLKADIEAKKKLQKELANKIEEIIREEAEKSKKSKLTPRDKIISGDFEKNKGALPWPTITGIITGKYGEHWHPVVKAIKTKNIGIDITTKENEAVRAVFKGEVSKVFSLKGANYTIILKHGTYYTLYHNLKSVNVKIGDKVEVKEVIGVVSNNNTENVSTLHFQIWKGKEILNPELWLAKE